MAIEAVGATFSLASAGTATVTPPAGETWAITLLTGDQDTSSTATIRYAVGVTAGSTAPRTIVASGQPGGAPTRTLVIDAAHYLSVVSDGFAGTVVFSGVKL